MSNRLTIGVLLALLALTSCQGGAVHPISATEIRLVNVSGASATQGVTLQVNAQSLKLEFSQVPATGQLLHLELPADLEVRRATWSTGADVLQLVTPAVGGSDIGVVPLAGYSGAPLTLDLRLGPATRTVSGSQPPMGASNALIDLTLEQGGAGQVRLAWTEINRGDYDFNGEVNLADILPLGKLLHQQASEDPAQQTYWVDGDHNGELNPADLQIIALHYKSAVDGYTILRNGAPVLSPEGTLPTIPREQAQSQAHAPPHYLAVLNGSPVDTWEVEPTYQGATGSDNTVAPVALDLSVKLSSAGMLFYNLDGSGTGFDVTGRSKVRIIDQGDLLRIIDPGDDPYCLDIGSATGDTTGNAGFNHLPRGQWMLAQLLFAPTVDPATGAPLAWNAAKPHYIALHVPVFLPAGSSVGQLTVSTLFTKLPGGKYTVRVSSLLQTNKRLQTSVLLDFAGQQVSVDTNNDGSFNDEFWAADPRQCGLSTQRLQQLVDYTTFAGGTNLPVSLTGTFSALDQASGVLNTTSSTVSVTEQTTVQELLTTATGTVSHEISPAELLSGDDLSLSGFVLDGVPGQTSKVWITGIVRNRDLTLDDKLYAVPAKTVAWPGEAVTIDVMSQKSASAFYALNGVRVTYNNANYVVDSFNAGAPGGDRDAVDGVWSQLGATVLAVPLEKNLAELPLAGGRKAIDFFVLPQDGTEIPHATGELFNFKLNVLGTVTLGIQRLDGGGIKRSYYTDAASAEHFWADDFNQDVPSITVQDPGSPGGP